MDLGVSLLYSLYIRPPNSSHITRFSGTAGQAIVSKTGAYLITDSRYWLQAEDELDANWALVRAPMVEGPKDWQSWLLVSVILHSVLFMCSNFEQERVKDGARIGIDARMISWAKASQLSTQLQQRNSKLVFPPQNLIDLIWKSKPPRSKEAIFLHGLQFAGQAASDKIQNVRVWISEQPPAKPSYSKAAATEAQKHVATLITSLPNIGK